MTVSHRAATLKGTEHNLKEKSRNLKSEGLLVSVIFEANLLMGFGGEGDVDE